jgi:hypothetical protein
LPTVSILSTLNKISLFKPHPKTLDVVLHSRQMIRQFWNSRALLPYGIVRHRFQVARAAVVWPGELRGSLAVFSSENPFIYRPVKQTFVSMPKNSAKISSRRFPRIPFLRPEASMLQDACPRPRQFGASLPGRFVLQW